MLSTRSKWANRLTLCATVVSFLLALYDLFYVESGVSYTGQAWFISFFSLLAIIFTVTLFGRYRPTALILQVLSLIMAGIIAVFAGLYWILVCMIIAVIGSILFKANQVH